MLQAFEKVYLENRGKSEVEKMMKQDQGKNIERKRRIFSFRHRIFVCFIAIAVVPLLVLGLYSYHSGAEAVKNSIRQSNEVALAQIELKTEGVIDSFRQKFLQIAGSSEAIKIAEQDERDIPYLEINQFIDSICKNPSYIDFADGYSFLNYKKRWVLSNKGIRTMDSVENGDWVNLLSEEHQRIFWVNHVNEMIGDNKLRSEYINDHYLMLVLKIPVYAAHTDAVLVLNLKQNAMEELFRESLGNGALTVLDQDGGSIYSENSAVDAYFQKYPETLEQTGTTSIETETGRYEIVKRKAPESGWTYIASYSPHEWNNQLRSILLTMMGIIAVVLVLIFVISGFGSFFMYKPVKKLVTQVKEIVPGGEPENEFELIQEGLHSLAYHNEELKAMIDRQKDQLSELFAMRLIRGRIKEEEIQATKERLQLEFEPYLCVSSVIFCPKHELDREQTAMDALNLELLNHFPDEIRRILLFPPFIYTRVIIMIIDGDSPEKIEEKLLALRNNLSVFVSEICGGYMDMGVSRIFQRESGFRKAYNESLEALKVNESSNRDEDTEGISVEDSFITYYGDLIRHSGDSSDYNLVLDTAVKEAIDSCDQEKAFAITDEFLAEMNKSGIVLYEKHYYHHRFLLAILSVPADAGIPIHDLFPEGEENLFLQFNQLYDSRNIRNFYQTKVIQPVIERMNQFRKNSSEVVLEKIMELVKESNGDLTLGECAERLGYHPSYIWRVMKNTRDTTFTDYIAKQKLEMAKQLLAETELTIAEIAERLSYSNAQNFIRLFKKHMEITPGQYRKQNKK